ncbi:MAG: hypothetical protein Q8P35_00560 [Candidatus Yanofskybacteria bacterium]|nr:hypothetical protein [Candidatus Yanofskybacteria bacterium]
MQKTLILALLVIAIIGISRRYQTELNNLITRDTPSASISPSPSSTGVTGTPSSSQSLEVTKIQNLGDGARMDWSHSGNNLIAFDKLESDGFYDIYAMKPDETEKRCLTCNHANLPNRHIGQPAWHPSGNYIVFQAEKANHESNIATKLTTMPGSGVYNDLWIMTSNGKDVFQLTNLPNSAGYGVLHPHFSDDGRKLSWSELYEPGNIFTRGRQLGSWKIKVADFAVRSGTPVLENIKEYQPGDPVFYENHGFSSDSKKLIFTSNLKNENFVGTTTNIYTLELATQKLTQLTTLGYNEHAIYSPKGDYILWMTDHQNTSGTDYWIMKPDGSAKKRITFFNVPSHPHYWGKKVVASDSSWSPDGKQAVIRLREGSPLSASAELENILLLTFGSAI